MLCSHELDSIISSDDEDESGRVQEVLCKRARPSIAVPSLCQQRAVEAAEVLISHPLLLLACLLPAHAAACQLGLHADHFVHRALEML